FVEAVGGAEDSDAGLARAQRDGPADGRRPAMLRQQRRVVLDRAVTRDVHEGSRRQLQHVSHHAQVGVERSQAAVQSAQERDIIVVTLTGRNDGRLRDKVQLMENRKRKRMTSAPLALGGATLVVALAAGFLLSACAQLLISGATTGGTVMHTDRRTSSMQVEDQIVEFKASSRVHDAIGDRGHVTITSYNREVLITGACPVDAAR